MINLRSLTLARGNKVLLDAVDVTFQQGQNIGLIGANGAGKTTLFALLAVKSNKRAATSTCRHG